MIEEKRKAEEVARLAAEEEARRQAIFESEHKSTQVQNIWTDQFDVILYWRYLFLLVKMVRVRYMKFV